MIIYKKNANQIDLSARYHQMKDEEKTFHSNHNCVITTHKERRKEKKKKLTA